MRVAAITLVIKVGGRFQQRTENIHKLADICNEGLQRIEPRAGNLTSFCLNPQLLCKRLDLINFGLVIHRPCDDGDLPQLDFLQVPDAVLLIIVSSDRVISNREFVQDAIFEQRLDVPPSLRVADFAPDIETFFIFTQFERFADWQVAVIVLR